MTTSQLVRPCTPLLQLPPRRRSNAISRLTVLAAKDVPHERVCLSHSKVAVALTPSNDNAGKFNGFSSVRGPFPSSHSFCSLSPFRFYIPNHFSFSGRPGWFLLVAWYVYTYERMA
jgi:hypothetical protein